jgi:Putative Actinobacterial Holin-X, holin superfamily III
MARSDATRTGSALSLLSDVVGGVGRLVEGEFRLARAEATEGVKVAAGGLVKLALAAIFGLVGLNALAGAAVARLTASGLGPTEAALVIGLGFCVVALGLALAGRSALRMRRLWPGRAFRGLHRDRRATVGSVLNWLGRLFGTRPDVEPAYGRQRDAIGRWEDDGGPSHGDLDDPDAGWLTKALALRHLASGQLMQIDAAQRRGVISAQDGAQLREEVIKALVRDTTEVLVEGAAPDGAARDEAILARERAYLAALPGRDAVGPQLAGTAVALAGVGMALAFLTARPARKARRFAESRPA